MSLKYEKMQAALRDVAAEFLAREAGPQSLITVTGVRMREESNSAVILITVLPDSQEEAALTFANRQRAELARFLTTRVRGMRAPHLEFEIDRGEKNRQRLDELTS
jgi:ribosome-binding factor A